MDAADFFPPFFNWSYTSCIWCYSLTKLQYLKCT